MGVSVGVAVGVSVGRSVGVSVVMAVSVGLGVSDAITTGSEVDVDNPAAEVGRGLQAEIVSRNNIAANKVFFDFFMLLTLQSRIDFLLKIFIRLGTFEQFAIDQEGGCGLHSGYVGIGYILIHTGSIVAIVETSIELIEV